MSVTLSEFLNAWNETMPMQIRESDVKNPTEQVLRRLLITMFRQFYVDTSCFDGIDSESGNRLRASRVKLVAIANHFYKIANPNAKQDFCYMDLIQPGFKKVFNVLNYLLNYCVFVRQTYTTTILDLKDKLRQCEDLRTTRNKLRKDNEQAKIKCEDHLHAIQELEDAIPQQKAMIAELEEKKQKLKVKEASVQGEIESAEIKTVELKKQIEDISMITVSQQEIENILSAKKTIDKQLEEQDQIISAGRQKLKENSKFIEEAQAITVKMEQLQSSFNFDAVNVKSDKKKIEELQVEISNLNTAIEKHFLEYDLLSQQLNLKGDSIAQLHQKQAELKKQYRKKDADQVQQLKTTEKLLRKLSAQEASLAAINRRLLDEQDLMFKLASNVIKHISNENSLQN